jgi:hypothetical protein
MSSPLQTETYITSPPKVTFELCRHPSIGSDCFIFRGAGVQAICNYGCQAKLAPSIHSSKALFPGTSKSGCGPFARIFPPGGRAPNNHAHRCGAKILNRFALQANSRWTVRMLGLIPSVTAAVMVVFISGIS